MPNEEADLAAAREREARRPLRRDELDELRADLIAHIRHAPTPPTTADLVKLKPDRPDDVKDCLALLKGEGVIVGTSSGWTIAPDPSGIQVVP
jgi:hypothetical protein